MKITAVEVFTFKYDHHYKLSGKNDAPNRLPGTDYYFEPQWRHAYSRLTESCLVKVSADNGLTGWGEAQAPLVPEVPATLIARLFGPAILGMDASDPQKVYDVLYHLNHVRGHTASYTIDAITAIDIALWDIKGKFENLPVNKLLGEVITDRLPLYVSGLRQPTLAERETAAKNFISQGFAGVKVFIGADAPTTLNECAAIRSAIGAEAELAFDAICRHDYDTALAIGIGLDELNAGWFEAPVDPEDIKTHAKLDEKIKTPIAIGEPLRTVREFEPWIEQKAMRIAQPDIVRCGITGAQPIIKLCRENGLRIAPHIGVCTAIGTAATWHVTSVIPDAVNQEHQYDMFEMANKLLINPLKIDAGKACVPQGKGLGIDINEEFVRKHSSSTWKIDHNGISYKEQ